MFKVIIADDEKRICALLEKIICWAELNLTLVKSCSNGEELLQSVDAYHPDIVITDIQMPGMNGIDAIRSIRESNNKCKIVIISGYQEFSYAHNALKYNVASYLLKPIDAEELNETLRKITLELSTQIAEDNVSQAATEDFRNNFISIFLPILAKQSDISLTEVNEKYGMEFKPGFFQGIYLYIDTGRAGQEVGSIDSLIGKLQDICGLILREVCTEVVFSERDNGLLIGINYDDAISINYHINQMFDRISPVIELFSDFGLTVGVGDAGEDLLQMNTSLEQAMEVIRFRSVIGKKRIIYWATLKDQLEQLQTVRELKDSVIPISRAFEAHSCSAFCKAYDSFLDTNNPSRAVMNFLFIEKVCQAFSAFLTESYPQYEKTAFLQTQFEFEFMHHSDFTKLAEAVRTIIVATLDMLKQHLMKKENLPIRHAKEYIYQNYSRPIRLEDIAAEVYLSPAYLSNVFKKVTGENIVNFINEYRVQQAKKLLVSTNMTVKEIASAVGFESHRYFGIIFQKNVGIKPSEYRKLYQ